MNDSSAFKDFLVQMPQDRFMPAQVIARDRGPEEALARVPLSDELRELLSSHWALFGLPVSVAASETETGWVADDYGVERLGLAQVDEETYCVLRGWGDFADGDEALVDAFTARLAQEIGGQWIVIAYSARPWPELFMEHEARAWGPSRIEGQP